MTALEITIILGTTREGRQTPRISDWIRRKIERRDDMTSRVVDLRDHPLPFYDRATLPVSGDYGPEGTNFAQVIAPADAFIIITPEYNHGVPAVLKNALDHIYAEWNRKPLAVIGYGGLYGGIRAVEALRQYAVELQILNDISWWATLPANSTHRPNMRVDTVAGSSSPDQATSQSPNSRLPTTR